MKLLKYFINLKIISVKFLYFHQSEIKGEIENSLKHFLHFNKNCCKLCSISQHLLGNVYLFWLSLKKIICLLELSINIIKSYLNHIYFRKIDYCNQFEQTWGVTYIPASKTLLSLKKELNILLFFYFYLYYIYQWILNY